MKEAAEENPQPEKRSEGSQPKQESDLVQNLNGLVKSMTSIKSVFIKTVKVDEECGAEYAYWMGGRLTPCDRRRALKFRIFGQSKLKWRWEVSRSIGAQRTTRFWHS